MGGGGRTLVALIRIAISFSVAKLRLRSGPDRAATAEDRASIIVHALPGLAARRRFWAKEIPQRCHWIRADVAVDGGYGAARRSDPVTMADLVARQDVDPVTLREDAARAKEMVQVLQAAKKAEDRRNKLMDHATSKRERRTLEKRFAMERKVDVQRITDLSAEREALLAISLRPAPAPEGPRDGRTLDFATGRPTVKERTMMGSNNLELKFFKDIYGKLDVAQPRRVPAGGRRSSGAVSFARSSARPDARASALLEKRDLLMRLSSLAGEEMRLLDTNSARSSAYSYRGPRGPGSAASAASRATSVASAATVMSRAPPNRPPPSRVPRLRL